MKDVNIHRQRMEAVVHAMQGLKQALNGPSVFTWLAGAMLWLAFFVAMPVQADTPTNPQFLTNVNGTLFFFDIDGQVNYQGHTVGGGYGPKGALWKSDGTAAGTVMVKHLNFDFMVDRHTTPEQFVAVVNNTLFFTAFDRPKGLELWKSDGTETGTVMVKDIEPGLDGSNPQYLTNVNGTLFFVATNDNNGSELWKSDGTEAGTVLVKDITPGAEKSLFPTNLINVNGTLFFTVGKDMGPDEPLWGEKLWKSNGTTTGTVMVHDPEKNFYHIAGNMASLNGKLFFMVYKPYETAGLWKSDGTAAGTLKIKEFVGCNDMTSAIGKLFFNASDGVHGMELWKTDGTTTGTTMVKDIAEGKRGCLFRQQLTEANGQLFFMANDGVNGNELWRSDGTEVGTRLVKDIRATTEGFSNMPGSSNPQELTNVNGTIFFTATDDKRYQLWKSDGTETGTMPVENVVAGELTAVNGTLFFVAAIKTATGATIANSSLWKSDGTEAGTVPVIWKGR